MSKSVQYFLNIMVRFFLNFLKSLSTSCKQSRNCIAQTGERSQRLKDQERFRSREWDMLILLKSISFHFISSNYVYLIQKRLLDIYLYVLFLVSFFFLKKRRREKKKRMKGIHFHIFLEVVLNLISLFIKIDLSYPTGWPFLLIKW